MNAVDVGLAGLTLVLIALPSLVRANRFVREAVFEGDLLRVARAVDVVRE